MTALELRCRALARVHVKEIARQFRVLCLTLMSAEQELAVKQIAVLLVEIAEGRTSLEPNDVQKAAAAAGREDITEADMLMFAARVAHRQRCGQPAIPYADGVEIIQALPMAQPQLEGGGPSTLSNS